VPGAFTFNAADAKNAEAQRIKEGVYAIKPLCCDHADQLHFKMTAEWGEFSQLPFDFKARTA